MLLTSPGNVSVYTALLSARFRVASAYLSVSPAGIRIHATLRLISQKLQFPNLTEDGDSVIAQARVATIHDLLD